jgi:hypothetical protein
VELPEVQMAMYITWKDSDDEITWPLSIEKKIDIFYQQLLGWQLHIADLMVNGGEPLGGGAKVQRIEHSGFAVLHICLSYFETIGKYRSPILTGGSKEQFDVGVQAVFPQMGRTPPEMRDKLLNVLYGSARCGLYHNSRTSHDVALGQAPNGEAIAYDPNSQTLVICPENLPRVLKKHLELYREELMNPTNDRVRQSFLRQFDTDFGSPATKS